MPEVCCISRAWRRGGGSSNPGLGGDALSTFELIECDSEPSLYDLSNHFIYLPAYSFVRKIINMTHLNEVTGVVISAVH